MTDLERLRQAYREQRRCGVHVKKGRIARKTKGEVTTRRVVEAQDRGLSIAEISAELGMSLSGVWSALKRRGAAP